MTAATLFAEMHSRGVTLEARGTDGLYVRPSSALTPEDRDRLRAAKPELLRLLGHVSAYREILQGLYALNAQGADADHATIAAALSEQARLLDELGPALAERISAETAAEWRAQHGRCPYCGEEARA